MNSKSHGAFRGAVCAPKVSNGVAVAVAGILLTASSAAFAQATGAATTNTPQAAPAAAPAEAPAPTDQTNSLQEVVVTASAAGVRKLDASYNIVTVSAEDLKNANPASVAEALKLSPGIWPESSGGQTGANIDIAGFPNGGGDSPYFTTMIQGSPIYGSADLSFMDSSSLVRLDDTVERLELVQGGTSAIFGPGQAGGIANFILKTGSDKSTGSIGVTYGFEGMERVDAFYSGKITDGWYGSIGGFYRKSDGVRDPQYPADIGGQLTGTLKHDLDQGSLVLWYRILDDKNLWNADFPYIVNGSTLSPYPGLNQLNQTYNSKALQNFTVPNPAGGWQNDDISNGRGAHLNYFGADLDEKLGDGWSIQNNLMFDGGYVNTAALVNSTYPETLNSYLGGLTLPTGLTAAEITPTYTNGTVVNGNQSVLTESVWDVHKKILSLTDEFRLAKDFGNGNTLTGGLYLAHYTDNDNWELGSSVLMTNQANANPILLTGLAGGDVYNVSSPQGIVNSNGYDIIERGDATNIAFYLSDSWRIQNWLVDASARVEHIDLSQMTSNTTNRQLGTAFDLWDNVVDLPNGTYTYRDEHNTMPTFSVGANYEFNDHMSAYARVNNGVFFDNFDDVRCNVNNGVNGCGGQPPLATVRNYEAGFKISNIFTYVDLSVFHKTFDGLIYTPVNAQDVPIGLPSTYGSNATGVRLIGSVNPLAFSTIPELESFKIGFNGDFVHEYYTGFVGCALYENVAGQEVCGSINGVQLARTPRVHLSVTPSDTQAFGWGSISESLTYEYVGQHYQDDTGLNPLGSYYDLSAGIAAFVGDNWEFRVNGSNLTNQIGLTEGNARVGGNAQVGDVDFGRSIFGREVQISAKYKF
jgi:outer membrane receptor protein involved in Fe transport